MHDAVPGVLLYVPTAHAVQLTAPYSPSVEEPGSHTSHTAVPDTF